MSNYTKATNFAAKDALPTGNAGKIVKGTEIDTELNAIAAAIASKADSNSPTFTGTPLAPTASPGTSTTQIATTAFAAAAAEAAFPVGGIIMWSGSIASIPSGWALCNGSNGTPDLRDRFVVGAGSTYAVDSTGGSANAIAVAHTHTYSGTTSSNGAHNHEHQAAGHTAIKYGSNGGYGNYGGGTPDDGAFLLLTSTNGAHTHTFSGTTDSTGSSGTNANLPPYYALAYIMKI